MADNQIYEWMPGPKTMTFGFVCMPSGDPNCYNKSEAMRNCGAGNARAVRPVGTDQRFDDDLDVPCPAIDNLRWNGVAFCREHAAERGLDIDQEGPY